MLGNNDELSRYMMQIEQYKEQISVLEQQMELLQAAINDYNKAKITLEKLNETEKDREILVPIGGRTFVNAKAKDPSKVLFDIGSGIVTEKKSEDAIKKINDILKELEEKTKSVADMIQKMQTTASEITAKAQKIYMEQQQG